MSGGWNAGTFTRFEGTSGCANKAAASIGITAPLEDQRFNEFATGINTCLTKDGQNVPTAALSMGGFNHTNVSAATAGSQYATATQVTQGSLTYASTTAGTSTAYTTTLGISSVALTAGTVFSVTFALTNGASPTLAVNSGSALAIVLQDGTAVPTGAIIAGRTYRLQQLGSSYVVDLTAGAAISGAMYATANQITGNSLLRCTTGGTSTAFTASLAISSGTTIQAGSVFWVNFNQTNGASATLSINGGAAQALYYSSGFNPIYAGDIISGIYYPVVNNGSTYIVFNVIEANQDFPRAFTSTLSTSGGFTLTATSTSNSLYYTCGDWIKFTLTVSGTIGAGSTSASYLQFTLPIASAFDQYYTTSAFFGGSSFSNFGFNQGLITGSNFRIGNLSTGSFAGSYSMSYRR